MQRTTVRLPDDLLRAAKRRAQQTGRTLTQLLEDCLRAELRQPIEPSRVMEPLPTYRGGGLRPGVDLSDSSALEDVMGGT
ncbi:MAG: CopG family transcriptional regulator [Gemmatimonadaceae bacterium]